MFAFRNWREEEPMKKILVITIACLLLSGIFSTTVRADGGAPPPCDPFFFSSRRRHTRSYGDWSSDVCSSDLIRTYQQRNRSAQNPEVITRRPEWGRPARS